MFKARIQPIVFQVVMGFIKGELLILYIAIPFQFVSHWWKNPWGMPQPAAATVIIIVRVYGRYWTRLPPWPQYILMPSRCYGDIRPGG
jgi:hypothetical protein